MSACDQFIEQRREDALRRQHEEVAIGERFIHPSTHELDLPLRANVVDCKRLSLLCSLQPTSLRQHVFVRRAFEIFFVIGVRLTKRRLRPRAS